MVKTMFAEAGLSGNKSNHSLRVAGACSLFAAGVPERVIQGRTGHVSIEALRKYERVTENQELAVSKILTGERDSFEASDSSVVPTVSKIQKKQLPPLLLPSGPQYNNCSFNVSYSAPPSYHAFPGRSHFQPPLPSPTVSPNFGASEPQLSLSDMPTVPACFEY